MMTSIRKTGDLKLMWPKGVKSLHQVPWYLYEAQQHALSIISWFENYQEKEIPDENLWDDPSALEEHWKLVKQRREDERQGVTAASEDTTEGNGDMMDNAYARTFKR